MVKKILLIGLLILTTVLGHSQVREYPMTRPFRTYNGLYVGENGIKIDSITRVGDTLYTYVNGEAAPFKSLYNPGTTGGDMLSSMYDPQNIQGDAFDRVNMTGTQGMSSITGLQDSLNKKLDAYIFEDVLRFTGNVGNTEIDVVNYTGGSWEVPDSGSISFGLYLYQDSGFPTGSSAPTLFTLQDKIGSTSNGYVVLDGSNLVFSLFGGVDEVFVDITGLDSTYLNVKLNWSSVSDVSVVINGDEVSHITGGHGGSYPTDNPVIGYGLGRLDDASVFDINIFNNHKYNGFPNGNTTEGWVDLIGTSDGTVSGTINTIDIQTNSVDTNHVLWLDEFVRSRIIDVGGGIAEAPIDGQQYARQNAGWSVISDSIFNTDTQTWIKDTIPKSDSVRVTYESDTTKTIVIEPKTGEDLLIRSNQVTESIDIDGAGNVVIESEGVAQLSSNQSNVFVQSVAADVSITSGTGIGHEVIIISQSQRYDVDGDTIFADGTGGSTTNNAKFKNFFATGGFFGGLFEGDTVKINNSDGTYFSSHSTAGAIIKSGNDEIVFGDSEGDFVDINSNTSQVKVAGDISLTSTDDIFFTTSTNEIAFREDTVDAAEENLIVKTLRATDSIQQPDGTWTTGTTPLKTAIEATGLSEINFDTATFSGHSEGRVWYDEATRTFSFQNDVSGFTHNLGENNIRVYNNTASTITDGMAVRRTGTYTNGGRVPTIALAGNTTKDSSDVLGLTTVSIAPSTYGVVTILGDVNDLNTTPLAENDYYLGFAGVLIDTSPPPPYRSVRLGVCSYSDNDSGSVSVKIELPVFRNIPMAQGYFVDSSVAIPCGVGVEEHITNATSNLFISYESEGVTFQGDSMIVLIDGLYATLLSMSFSGSNNTITWTYGLYVNDVKIFEKSRTTGNNQVGDITVPFEYDLMENDVVKWKITNETNNDDPTITDATIKCKLTKEL